MKALIIDKKGQYAAALKENGEVVRIPDQKYRIGQTVELEEAKDGNSHGKGTKAGGPIRLRKRIGAAAAAVLLLIGAGAGTAYAMPYGTVTLDGDTSITYTVNCFDYVLDVQAADDEGSSILSEIDVKELRHKRVDQAIETTVEKMEQGGLLEKAETPMQISVETKNENHSEKLRQELEPFTERKEGKQEAPAQELETAREAAPVIPGGPAMGGEGEFPGGPAMGEVGEIPGGPAMGEPRGELPMGPMMNGTEKALVF